MYIVEYGIIVRVRQNGIAFNSEDRIMQVVIVSERIELYYYIQKYLKSKYTVTKYEKQLFYEKIKKAIKLQKIIFSFG